MTKLGFSFLHLFHVVVSLYELVAFVVLGVVCSVPSQDIGWAEHLQMTYFVSYGK